MYLAPKRLPGFLILSIAMVAEYSSYVKLKFIATFALTFYGYIILILASVFPHIQPNLGGRAIAPLALPVLRALQPMAGL